MANEDLDTLIKEIKEAAAARGVSCTLRQLAAYIEQQTGIRTDHTTFASLFTYKRRPTVEWVQKVAMALGGPTNRWLRLAGHTFVPYEEPRFVVPVETLDEIMTRVDEETEGKLTDDERDIIRRIIADELGPT